MYRQGDVLLIPVPCAPEGAQRQKREGLRIILATGEATGHAHAVETVGAELLASGTERFLRVPAGGASVTHEEHAPIALPAGTYRVVVQREYSPEEIRRVAD